MVVQNFRIVGERDLIKLTHPSPFLICSPSAKKSGEARKQAGKKERGWGEGIFARLLCPAKRGWGWKSVSAIPASAGRQNRKIFVSLIEKNFGGAPLKNDEKIFLFCSPSGGEPLGGIAALRAAISRCSAENEF